MRVWLSPSSFAPHLGGVEEVALRTAQRLQGSGDEVLVVTNRWPLDLPAVDRVEGVPVHRLPFLLPASRPGAVLAYLRRRAENVRTLGRLGPAPDVVHVHCASSQLPTIGAYARRHRVPVVLSTHGETVMDAHGLFQASRFMRWALRYEADRAAALTACSGWTRDATAEMVPAFAAAPVVLNGVQASAWPSVPLADEPVLAAWGRHVPQKGFDLLLQAFPLVRAVLPQARLLLGGTGPETSQLAASAGPGVELLGPLDRDGVRSLLARSRVVVVPSRVEPFGIVAVEGLACGRGLVYSAGTGLAEAAGGLGRAVDPHDPQALATALVEELRSPTPAAAGRAWAASLDWDDVARRYRAHYPPARR